MVSFVVEELRETEAWEHVCWNKLSYTTKNKSIKTKIIYSWDTLWSQRRDSDWTIDIYLYVNPNGMLLDLPSTGQAKNKLASAVI